jgi:hypothetical protein
MTKKEKLKHDHKQANKKQRNEERLKRKKLNMKTT